MKAYTPILTIAGSDCSGGAGIQADIKAISALGGYAMSVITATTAQNTQGVREVFPLPPQHIEAQLRAVLEDISPCAIKTGMLFTTEIIETIERILREYPHIPLVVDPVMVSTSGHRLLEEDAVQSYLSRLLPIATLITPNIPEAEVLSGVAITSPESRDEAGRVLIAKGAKAVLIKGGHWEGGLAIDTLYTAEGQEQFVSPRVKTTNTHGTGCTLSSAIATCIGQGKDLAEAIRAGKEYLTQALVSGMEMKIGHGSGPVNHFWHPISSIKR